MTGSVLQPDPSSPLRLCLRGVTKQFGSTQALRGVDLSVLPGEVMALVGENGAGKSTLMKILSGAHRKDQGEMSLNGETYEPRNPLHARECGIAMIYQELSLAPHLSIMDNILLGIEPRRGILLDRRRMHQSVRAALQEVGLGDLNPDRIVGRLSPAQQQLVEIARAVTLDCKILVLDEPTSSLTLPDIERLFALIRRLKEKNISVIYISHFLEEIQKISDRFTVLRDGETVGSGETASTSSDQIIAMMVGREVSDLYPRSRHEPGEVLLSVEEIGGQTSPRRAGLILRRGEVIGIAGLMGAGRTEFLRCIFGLDPVKKGRVTLKGDQRTGSPGRRWMQGMGMVSEDRKNEGLATGLSIAENLTLPHLHGLGPWRLVLPGRQHRSALPWIRDLSIKCSSPGQRISGLSGGNQQKVAIARLLHAGVEVYLLDEPTRGIDVGSKAQIYSLIDQLARGNPEQNQPPCAVLVISSYLPELLGICDRIAVMHRGELGPARKVEDWDEHKLMLAATGGESSE
ncbi:MAG: sugar ABC transporter ATP-binding protein [Kiritimatiellia bacterium]